MTRSVFLAVMLLLGVGCSFSNADGGGLDLENGSIDGIRLGDTWETVREQVGSPQIGSGAVGETSYLTYRTGSEDRLYVVIAASDTEDEAVVGIQARAAYEGQTRLGVGIGSSRADVEREFGAPASCTSDAGRGEFCTYPFASHEAVVQYSPDGAHVVHRVGVYRDF